MKNLQTFFEEKYIPFTAWEIKYNGQNHSINSDVVIEAILATKGDERRKIANALSILDFRNESILDYLHFLAKCMIENRK